MEQMLPSDPPDSDDGRNETSAWTGQKKHKLALDPCVSGDTNQDADACTSSFSDTQAKTAAQQVLEVTNKNIADAMRRTIFPGKEYLLKASSGEETSQRIDEQDIHFGPDIQFSNEDFDDYVRQLAPNSRHIDKFSRVSDDKFDEIMERHARYRIGFYKMFNKESGDKLKDPAEYSRGELLDENYFHRYEWDESLGWYFHPDHIGRAGLNDYQKLVLVNHDSTEFLARDDYHSCFNTYEVDDDYVKYCGEISKKIKWIGDYLGLDRSSIEWSNTDNRAWFQALKIATGFRHMTVGLAHSAYLEYIWDLRGIRRLTVFPYFLHEIWKLVAKQKMNFTDALKAVYEMDIDMFQRYKHSMEAELNGDKLFALEWKFSMCVEDISDDVEEAEAFDLITNAVYRTFHHTQTMWGYAAKKIDMAKKIGLV